MNVPFWPALLSSDTDNKVLDLLVVLVPHIVRSAELTAQNTRAVASGVEQDLEGELPPPASTPAAGRPEALGCQVLRQSARQGRRPTTGRAARGAA